MADLFIEPYNSVDIDTLRDLLTGATRDTVLTSTAALIAIANNAALTTPDAALVATAPGANANVLHTLLTGSARDTVLTSTAALIAIANNAALTTDDAALVATAHGANANVLHTLLTGQAGDTILRDQSILTAITSNPNLNKIDLITILQHIDNILAFNYITEFINGSPLYTDPEVRSNIDAARERSMASLNEGRPAILHFSSMGRNLSWDPFDEILYPPFFRTTAPIFSP